MWAEDGRVERFGSFAPDLAKSAGFETLLRCAGEADLAQGALGAEVVGELERRAGAWSDGGVGGEAGEGEEAGGLLEAEAGAELAGGGAEDAAAERGIEGAEAVDLEGEGLLAGGGGDGAAAAADGFAG
jgi:hypothetical protein